MHLPEQALPETGLRKAALLVAGLDRASADAVLAALGPDASRQLRRAVLELDQVDPLEQQQAIEEFLEAAPRRPSPSAGVELDEGLARRLGIKPREVSPPTESEIAPPTEPPFRFLQQAQVDKLAKLLAAERPQTIAVVLAHLPAEQAASVLGHLADDLQAEVLRRLADLEETDPEILRELEHVLQARFVQEVGIRPRRVAGLGAIGDIVQAANPSLGRQIIENLNHHDPKLTAQLGPPSFDFDDLGRLDDAGLRLLFGEIDGVLLSTALIGAPRGLASRFLDVLSEPEAAEIHQQVDHPGPIQLRDIDTARKQIADRAWCLALQGRLRLPNRSGPDAKHGGQVSPEESSAHQAPVAFATRAA